MRRHKRALVVGACVAAWAGAANAQSPTTDRGVYFGAGLGQSQAIDYDCRARQHCETQGTVVKYFAGWQFAPRWAAEVGYTDLGRIGSENAASFKEDIKVRLGEATVVGSYPATGRLMIYGKAGGYYAHTTDDLTATGARLSESDGGVTWGFGLQYYVWRGVAARVDGQRYMKVGGGNIGEIDFKVYTIGLLYKM
jgi:hypothetical protein